MAWWDRLPRTLQAWLAALGVIVGMVGTAFAVGAVTSKSFEVSRELPGRMDYAEATLQEHGAAITTLFANDARSDFRYNRLICLLLLPDSLSAIEMEDACPPVED